jgi:mono/diheme cytochrome c family protein
MKRFVARVVIPVGLVAVFATITSTQGATPGANQESKMTFSGATLFDDYCKACHGVRAIGDGPLAKLLRRPPANLTLLARKNDGVFSAEMVSRIIDGRKPLAGHGGGDMPVWGEAFGKSVDGADTTPTKITALVAYLESIQQKP